MIAITCNHLAKLLKSIFDDGRIGLGRHALKGFPAPGRDFALQKNSVAVAVIKNAFVLGPMDTRENTVQFLEIVVVVVDPFCWLCHSEPRIAASHSLDTHQAHALAIQMKDTIPNLKFADAE